MQDSFLKAHFDKPKAELMSIYERNRITATHSLIPESWNSLIDVGCGDGRVSNPLAKKGFDVFGIDWSENSLQYCEFPTISGDITSSNLSKNSYDGAICAEVLEHLTNEQVEKVVDVLNRVTRHGFIVSVPAREILSVNMAHCTQCNEQYHIYGHLRSFQSFEDVDEMIGRPSIARRFIANSSIQSNTIAKLRPHFGIQPYFQNALCPYCGTSLDTPIKRSLLNRVLFKLITAPFKLFQMGRAPGGWFICRYESDES